MWQEYDMKSMKQRELEDIIVRDNLIIESLVQWVTIEHERKDIFGLFSEMGYRKIAIYGYGHLGKLLETLLKDSEIRAVCVLDRKFKETEGYYLSPTALPSDLDAVIVTNTYFYREIRDGLLKNGCTSEIRMLDELLFQL